MLRLYVWAVRAYQFNKLRQIAIHSDTLYRRCQSLSYCRRYRMPPEESAIIKPWGLFAFLWFFNRKKTDEEMDPDYNVIFPLKRAILSQRRLEPDKAKFFYHQALEGVQEHELDKTWSRSKIHRVRVKIYAEMANHSMALGDWAEAEELFKETMRGLMMMKADPSLQEIDRPENEKVDSEENDSEEENKLESTDGNVDHQQKPETEDNADEGDEADVFDIDNAITESSLKLAAIYAMQENFMHAEVGYKFCLKTQETKVKELQTAGQQVDTNTRALLGMVYEHYGNFLKARGRLQEALKFFQQSLDVAEDVFGTYNEQVAMLHNNVATVAMETSDSKTAFDHVKRSVHIAKRIDSENVPLFLCNHAAMHYQLGEYGECKRKCADALKLAIALGHEEAEERARQCVTQAQTRLTKSAGNPEAV